METQSKYKVNKHLNIPEIKSEPTCQEHTPKPTGVKFDSEKPNLDLVIGDFANALFDVGRVGTFGANKYSPSNWLIVENAQERYASAMLRHYLAHKQGGFRDEESGLLHLSHMVWNALAVLELEIRDLK
jgi:hypothetical protein